MFQRFVRIFQCLSPNRTRQHSQPRKPMAIPVAPNAHNRHLCEKLFTELDAAEAEVLNDINDPEKAWPLLSKIRQLRRETQQEFATLSPADRMSTADQPQTALPAVRTVMTPSGIPLSVFNGGQPH